MTKPTQQPDTSIGAFVRQLNWLQMFLLMIAALVPYLGAGLVFFCLVADYRKYLNEK